MNQSKNRAKERWAMLPVIFALAWATMLEELMQTLVQYIDTAMVGALGTEATAAVPATIVSMNRTVLPTAVLKNLLIVHVLSPSYSPYQRSP